MSKLQQFNNFLESINVEGPARDGIIKATSILFESINSDDFHEILQKLKSTLDSYPERLKEIFDIQTEGLSMYEKNELTARLASSDNKSGMSEKDIVIALSGTNPEVAPDIDEGHRVDLANVEVKPAKKVLDPRVVKANQLFGKDQLAATKLYAQAANDTSINSYSKNYALGALRHIQSLYPRA